MDPQHRLLLEVGADRAMALVLACASGHADIAQLLLQNGADVEHGDICDGSTALAWACLNGRAEVVRLLRDVRDAAVGDAEGRLSTELVLNGWGECHRIPTCAPLLQLLPAD